MILQLLFFAVAFFNYGIVNSYPTSSLGVNGYDVSDSDKIKKLVLFNTGCRWRGEAPNCDGHCEQFEYAIRTANKSSSYDKNFGEKCTSGTKTYCCLNKTFVLLLAAAVGIGLLLGPLLFQKLITAVNPFKKKHL